MKERIEQKLEKKFSPEFLEVINQSRFHRRDPKGNTHFQVVIVSQKFENQSLKTRHKSVFSHLQEEIKQGVHALTLRTLTPKEWLSQRDFLGSFQVFCKKSKKD